MAVFLFPGQGSQRRGMGGSLFEKFRELTTQADKILGYSVEELCLTDPLQVLNETKYTQPALFVVNALSYLRRLKETGTVPNFVAGHSVGEFNALFAAGVFDFETGLRLVQKRAELMSSVTNGAMAAIRGASVTDVERILAENGLFGVDIAAENAPFQVVVAGLKTDLDAAKECFTTAGVEFIPLKVSGPFHSRYMSQVANEYREYLKGYSFCEPRIPVIANVRARPYRLEDCRDNLTQQFTQPVQWVATIRFLLHVGNQEFDEIGPGLVLTNLGKSIRTETGTGERNPSALTNRPSPLRRTAGGEVPVAAHRGTRAWETPPTATKTMTRITATSLGSREFRDDYNLKYAYVTGSMYRGIASEQLVIRAGQAGMLGFFGTGGLSLARIEAAIRTIQGALGDHQAYGMNLLHQPDAPELEDELVDLYLRYGVRCIEASAYINLSKALVRFRAKGLKLGTDGAIEIANRVLAKVSHPEVAKWFLSPAPPRMVSKLLAEQGITDLEAELLEQVPMADDVCVEADSGGHTDQGVMSVLLPTMLRLRDEMMDKHRYPRRVRIGAAGGIGTPEAAAAAFLCGADFILTGSINQCTVESGTSDAVKDLLQGAGIQDTDHVPAADMFEMGSKVQVLKKGLFFPARARKLYELYQRYVSLDELDEEIRRVLEEKYFRQSFQGVEEDLRVNGFLNGRERDDKRRRMARVFKWYLRQSTSWALSGEPGRKIDYQIHTGPAMGAFNQWVKGTPAENWRARHVDEIGLKIMNETAQYLSDRWSNRVGSGPAKE